MLDEIPSPVPPHTNGAEIDPKFFSHLDDSVQKIIQKEKIQEEYQKVGYIEVFKGNTCHVLKILDNLHVIVIIPDRHIMYLLKKWIELPVLFKPILKMQISEYFICTIILKPCMVNFAISLGFMKGLHSTCISL